MTASPSIFASLRALPVLSMMFCMFITVAVLAGDDLDCDPVEVAVPYDGTDSTAVDIALNGDSLAILQGYSGADGVFTHEVLFYQRLNGDWIPGEVLPYRHDTATVVWPKKSLDMSSDTLIAGIANYTDSEAALVTIYGKTDAGWQNLVDIHGDGNRYFGVSVAITDDFAAISSPAGEDPEDDNKVLIYRRYGTTWSLQQILRKPETTWFGTEVAIDGSSMMVSSIAGGVWFYEFIDESWIETQSFESGLDDAPLAGSVDLTGDLAIAGGYWSNDQNIAQIFRRTDGVWALEAALESLFEPTDDITGLGGKVKIQENLAVASSGRQTQTESIRRVHVFELNETQWEQISVVQSIHPSKDGFYYPAELSLSDRQVATGFVQGPMGDEFGVVTLPVQLDGDSIDCDTNGRCDALDLADGNGQDCDGNGILDRCDIDNGLYPDVDLDGVPDVCESDCDGDLVPDDYELEQGQELDCNSNGIPDSCDLQSGSSSDDNGDGVPDECGAGVVITVATDGTAMFTEIQSAIDASYPGATIEVGSGTYQGPVVFPAHPLTLISVNGPDQTILIGSSGQYAIHIGEGHASETVLDGFTVTNTSSQLGGGLLISQSRPRIHDCLIKDNHGLQGAGLGILSAAPVIENCRFLNNFAERGGGMNVLGTHDSGEAVVVSNCLFESNHSNGSDQTSGSGGGLAMTNALAEIANCEFNGNTSEFTGGGLVVNNSNATITGSRFLRNVADFPGGAGARITGNLSIQDSEFCQNAPTDLLGTWIDLGGNSFNDACECPDANGDGEIDVNDILIIIDAWGDCVPDQKCPADVDADGFVNVNDVLLVISGWGLCE